MNVSSEVGSDLFGRFFLPGPTEVRPEILEAQVGAMFGHRGPKIRQLMGPLQEGLKQVFRTERPVLISASSATGLMEAAVRNGVRHRVLCLVNGAFSERFVEIAEACGKDVEVLSVAWGEVHDPEAVDVALAAGDFDAVTVVHSETSTGALQPLEALAEVVRRHDDVVLLVDAVTSIGGARVETDLWQIDFVLTGSQKAMALPPGLAFGVASERMIDRAASIPNRGVYFDLVRFQKNVEKLQTPNTPALSLMFAAVAQFECIADEGMENRWARHEAMAAGCSDWVASQRARGLALEMLVDEPDRSPTVTCVKVPDGMIGGDIVSAVRDRGYVIGGGYGRLAASTFRIGHMGDHSVEEMNQVLEVVGEVVAGL